MRIVDASCEERDNDFNGGTRTRGVMEQLNMANVGQEIAEQTWIEELEKEDAFFVGSMELISKTFLG